MASDESTASAEPLEWWKKRWVQNGILVLVTVAGVYGLVYWDVVTRARQSYHEAEKYMQWNAEPQKKKEFLEMKFQADKIKLDALLSEKKISDEEYRKKLDALQFDLEYALNESSLKYAYQWYKDTYELFSPPESKWVRMARAKAPEALEMWKAELKQQNVPFEDYMFE